MNTQKTNIILKHESEFSIVSFVKKVLLSGGGSASFFYLVLVLRLFRRYDDDVGDVPRCSHKSLKRR